ncbi:MAG TPA: diguanylate cyclase [Rhizobiaceae bacterium]|nr:diguanylate cyclase [Rhizobiaceae bacterium]
MRGSFSARNFDIVMVMDAILISLACLLVILAYREINGAPLRHSQDLAATVMAMSDDLAREDDFSGMRLDSDGTMHLRRRFENAKAQVTRAKENSSFVVYSDHPNLAGLSDAADEFRTEALKAIRAGEPMFSQSVMIDGASMIRIAAPLQAAGDCVSCADSGTDVYKRGDVIGIREIILPVGNGFANTIQKLLFACGMLASSLMLFLGIIIPMIKRSRQEKAQFHNLAASLEVQASTDPLTGLHNRRYFEQALQEYLTQFNAKRMPLGLLVFDLDHFKKVNDTHGHDAGDMVLREVALRLRAITRDSDVVARIGGEEFAVITPYATEEQLMAVAERYRTMISALNIPIGRVVLKPTISIGVATNADGTNNAHDLFKAADNKLYQAKREGRNRIAA